MTEPKVVHEVTLQELDAEMARLRYVVGCLAGWMTPLPLSLAASEQLLRWLNGTDPLPAKEPTDD